MSNECSDAFKIRRAPNGKFYVWGNGDAICLPNGNLRYFVVPRGEFATWRAARVLGTTTSILS